MDATGGCANGSAWCSIYFRETDSALPLSEQY
jgi:hypothetical protein